MWISLTRGAGIAEPTVRHIIACEDVRRDPVNPHKVTLANLVSAIESLEEPAFPLVHPELCVFVQLSECRGPADVEIKIAQADSEEFVYRGPDRPWRAMLPDDPIEVVGLSFRIRNLPFSERGLYWIQFWYNGKALAREPLLLR